ncbi:PIN domain-containing protein [Pseudorhizobium marinum]|uniref:PIN domain-containing protein n=1 Tax=Pseudorhizobium marinum TaxID=1496690 RepID=UPI001F443FBF|nr:PIN domain-containing protein [Pseudorhizobium marinum]
MLTISYRRHRLSLEEVWRSMHRLEQLRVTTSATANNALILTLAERHGLTAYDAAYLALAVEQNLPLATLDRKLSEAARREHVPLFGQAP